MNEALAVIDEMRRFEDFDKRNSAQKIDFYRKWYHTRSKSRLYSLEGAQKDYARAHNGQQWDAPDDKQDLEQSSLSQVMVDSFLETLTEKDKEILRLRMEGAGKKHPAGTNVVVVQAGSAYKYDVLAGFVDLSGYVEKESGKSLMTDAERTKLSGMNIAADAEANEMFDEVFGT